MTVLLSEGFNLADETTITTSNTGFTTKNSTGGTSTADTAKFVEGTASCRFDAAGNVVNLRVDFVSQTTVRMRFYCYLNAVPAVNTGLSFIESTSGIAVDIRSTGLIMLRTNLSNRGTGTAQIGAWFRVDITAVASTSVTVDVFNDPSSTTPTFTLSSSVSIPASFTYAAIGPHFGNPTITYWMDAVRLQDSEALPAPGFGAPENYTGSSITVANSVATGNGTKAVERTGLANASATTAGSGTGTVTNVWFFVDGALNLQSATMTFVES